MHLEPEIVYCPLPPCITYLMPRAPHNLSLCTSIRNLRAWGFIASSLLSSARTCRFPRIAAWSPAHMPALSRLQAQRSSSLCVTRVLKNYCYCLPVPSSMFVLVAMHDLVHHLAVLVNTYFLRNTLCHLWWCLMALPMPLYLCHHVFHDSLFHNHPLCCISRFLSTKHKKFAII